MTVSGDDNEESALESLKGFPWVQVKYGDRSKIEAQAPIEHWPMPVVLNGKTAEVIDKNAF